MKPFLSLLMGLSLMVVGCTMVKAPVVPPGGLIFTNYKAPLTTNFQSTPQSSRVATSEAMFLREPFFGTTWAWGDASIQTAVRNSGMTTIHYADYEYLSVLGLFAKTTVRVHGD
jgi:hypothetical protein